MLAAVRSWSGPRAHAAAEVQREGKDCHEILSVVFSLFWFHFDRDSCTCFSVCTVFYLPL